jgi:hypothetical protein
MSTVRVFSPTMIETIRTCPLTARYRYVEHLQERTKSGALILGIAVDVAAKHVVHGLRSGEIKYGAVDAGGILDHAWGEEIARARDIDVVWCERGYGARPSDSVRRAAGPSAAHRADARGG